MSSKSVVEGADAWPPELERRLAALADVERFEPPPAAGGFAGHEAAYAQAEADPSAWWLRQALKLSWVREPTQGLDDSEAPFYRWFADGTLNASVNCLDRHVAAGHGDRVAIHWRGEEGEERDVTYGRLLADVQRFANAMKDRGVGRGDVVGIFLPMIPEVVVSMLACARIGAVHNVVFGGFSPESVKERMAFSEAKVLITVDGARRKGNTAPVKALVDEAGIDVETTFVVRHSGTDAPMGDGDVWYHEALESAAPECAPEELGAEHPLFILYSSGSTAKPKGIVHTTGGYLTQVAWTHQYVFDLRPAEDVYWCTADVGWITGHSYAVYGPLLNGATSVMYEGAPDYPAKDIWWEVCERFGVTIFYTAPTAIRAAVKWGVEHPGRHDLSKLRLLGTVGEPIGPKTWLWYREVIGDGRCPIVDTWWQTETGAILVTTLPGMHAAKPGAAGKPLPGIAVDVVDDHGGSLGADVQGLLVLTRPWPSMLRTLYKDDERFVATYWERFGPRTYFVGDASRRDADDYLWVIGRVDDVLNVSGHRISTAEIESAIVSHARVAEAAVIGQHDEDTGQSVTAFVVLKGHVEGSDELASDVRAHVARRIGKLARPKRVVWADDLPKTRSGKIMRRLLRDIAEGRPLGDVATLRDPSTIASLARRMSGRDDVDQQ
jgi:acetyl-CoA synthetase